ncbi:MAG: hypothetical protein EP343_29020 [Deltaproteobacteria bacterium]|nr:MAG: hypothetical protein EP343_29020 [Deltaproteobacteria bacterium]
MKFNKLALFVFLTTFVASIVFAVPLYSIVLIDLIKGTTVDWFLSAIIATCFFTTFASCFYSLVVLVRETSKQAKYTNLILIAVLVITYIVVGAYGFFLYLGSKY